MLVETADEVLGQLRGIGARLADHLRVRLGDRGVGKGQESPAVQTTKRDPEYTRLLAALDRAPVSLDELAQRSRLPVAALSSMLLVLELEGVVSAASGGRYVLERQVENSGSRPQAGRDNA
jgi:DNA processing protein